MPDSNQGNPYFNFRMLVDNSPAIMWITDENALCTYLSRQWYEITGRTAEQDLGFGWVENVHPDDRDAASKAFFSAVEARGRISLRYRLRHKDGSYRWSVDSGLPNISPSGKFLGYIGTVIDIHDQVVTEIEMNAMRERFNRSASATDLGVWYCDLPFSELIWNREVKNHFFMPEDCRVTIDDFYSHIHPDDRVMTKNAIDHSIAQKAPYDIIYRTVDPKDSSRQKWIRAIGWTDYDMNDNPIRFDGITLDMTADHLRQAELKKAKNEAENANELKTRFLANMSHEIRTPLSAILGFSDLLLTKLGNDPEARSYLTRISRNSAQLTRLIDEILDLSKIEAGKFTVESECVDLDSLIDDIYTSMIFKVEEKKQKYGQRIFLQFEKKFGKGETLYTDPVRFTQVLTNVIGNAIKFTNEGSVNVAFEKTDSHLMISVEDTGIGLSVEQQSLIFKPFTQADSSVTRRYGGTGLGLSLSKKLAALLEGDLKIERSEEGVGSLFKIQISTRLHRPTEISKVSPSDLKPTDFSLLHGKSVLLVDDSPDNRALVGHFLRSAGMRVSEAENGMQGVESAWASKHDIVLMDIQMPIMDGHQALKNLRSKSYNSPVIALTAHAFDEERQRCIDSGFNGFVTKPIDRNTLLQTIRNLILT